MAQKRERERERERERNNFCLKHFDEDPHILRDLIPRRLVDSLRGSKGVQCRQVQGRADREYR